MMNGFSPALILDIRHFGENLVGIESNEKYVMFVHASLQALVVQNTHYGTGLWLTHDIGG